MGKPQRQEQERRAGYLLEADHVMHRIGEKDGGAHKGRQASLSEEAQEYRDQEAHICEQSGRSGIHEDRHPFIMAVSQYRIPVGYRQKRAASLFRVQKSVQTVRPHPEQPAQQRLPAPDIQTFPPDSASAVPPLCIRYE